MKTRALVMGLLSLVVGNQPFAFSDDQPRGPVSVVQARTYSFELGMTTGYAGLRLAGGTDHDVYWSKQYQETMNEYIARLGLTVTRLPSLPKSSSMSVRMQSMVSQLLTSGQHGTAKELEQKWGKQNYHLYRWGIVMGFMRVINYYPALTAQELQGLIDKYTTQACLPTALGTPLVAALQGKPRNLGAAIVKSVNRSRYYYSDVLEKKADVAELADPEFDVKFERKVQEILKQRDDHAIEQEVAGIKNDNDRTNELLNQLQRRLEMGNDRYDNVGRRFRELGPRALPAICKHPLETYSPVREVPLLALRVTLFGLTVKEVQDGLNDQEIAKMNLDVARGLAMCLISNDTSIGATVALGTLSPQTKGSLIAVVIKHLQSLPAGSRSTADAALQKIAESNIMLGYDKISNFAKLNPKSEQVPKETYELELSVIRSIGVPAKTTVITKADELEWAENNPTRVVEMQRRLLEATGLLPFISPEVKAEKILVRAAWKKAVKEVDRNHPFLLDMQRAIMCGDTEVARLEGMMNVKVERIYHIGGIPDLVSMTLKEQARNAGQFAQNIAMKRDLDDFLEKRAKVVELYSGHVYNGPRKLDSLICSVLVINLRGVMDGTSEEDSQSSVQSQDCLGIIKGGRNGESVSQSVRGPSDSSTPVAEGGGGPS